MPAVDTTRTVGLTSSYDKMWTDGTLAYLFKRNSNLGDPNLEMDVWSLATKAQTRTGVRIYNGSSAILANSDFDTENYVVAGHAPTSMMYVIAGLGRTSANANTGPWGIAQFNYSTRTRIQSFAIPTGSDGNAVPWGGARAREVRSLRGAACNTTHLYVLESQFATDTITSAACYIHKYELRGSRPPQFISRTQQTREPIDDGQHNYGMAAFGNTLWIYNDNATNEYQTIDAF